MIQILQSLDDQYRVGDLVASRHGRAKWLIRQITTHPQRADWAAVYMTKPKGQKIYLSIFVRKDGEWRMGGEPTPLRR